MARLKATTFATRAEFEAAVNKIAELEVQFRKLTAKRDARIQEVQDYFAPDEARLQEELKGLLATTEKYADEHRDELFSKEKKSAETPLAVFGYRYGNPTVSLLNRRWTWDQIVKVLKLSRFKNLLREVHEVDKDAVKSAKLSEDDLAAVGMKITQSETFYIEPKLDGADAVRAPSVQT